MSLHVFSVHYLDVLPVLGLALVFLWLRLIAVSVRELFARVALTVTGYLRPRPDPAVEEALCTAFAELDRDLARILGDRTPRRTWPPTGLGESNDAGCFPARERSGKHPASSRGLPR